MKKALLMVLVLYLSQIGRAQIDTSKKEKTLYNNQFKWKVEVPEGFENLSDEQYAQLKKKGTDAMQQSANAPIDSITVRIFAFRNGTRNTFESNNQHFDPSAFGNFMTACLKGDEVLYNTFKKQLPAGTKIDTAQSSETFSNLTFHIFKADILSPNDRKLTLRMYSRHFEKNAFTATVLFLDEKCGDALLYARRNSKFEQN